MSQYDCSESSLHQYFCNTEQFSVAPLNKRKSKKKKKCKVTFVHQCPYFIYFFCRIVSFFKLIWSWHIIFLKKVLWFFYFFISIVMGFVLRSVYLIFHNILQFVTKSLLKSTHLVIAPTMFFFLFLIPSWRTGPCTGRFSERS